MMDEPALAELLESIIIAGVALTTRALSEASPDLELTLPQWRVLVVVGEREAGSKLTEIATRVGVTLPATSRQVHRLVRRGLIQVQRDERDRRAARVRLTETGTQVRNQILGFRQARIAETITGLPVSGQTLGEMAVIARALRAHR
jgi:DNA-binding MarR family transcriptional regulator